MSKLKGWKDIPIGGVIPRGGTAFEYETGSWRSFRPVHDSEKCINCLECWFSCPDAAIQVEDGNFKGFDLTHCKGCGICAKVCPPKVSAITMKPESEFEDNNQG
jgi:pyruvate ferredoxin oxidoreductase delta subunit